MESNGYSIVSLDREIHEEMADHVDREAVEKRLARRRCLKLVAIACVFLICSGILTISVVHDVQARAGDDLEWDTQFACQENDEDCLTLLCPEGMGWEGAGGECRQLPGYTCCTSCTQEYKCYKIEEADGVKCCAGVGVVPAAYKMQCRDGFLWVGWKKKCFRRN